MRWFVIILLLLFAAWALMPDPEPVPVEETFIAPQVEALEKAEDFEARYLEEADARKQRMEDALEGDG